MKTVSRKPRRKKSFTLTWKSIVSCLVLALTGDVVITFRSHVVDEITRDHVAAQHHR